MESLPWQPSQAYSQSPEAHTDTFIPPPQNYGTHSDPGSGELRILRSVETYCLSHPYQSGSGPVPETRPWPFVSCCDKVPTLNSSYNLFLASVSE